VPVWAGVGDSLDVESHLVRIKADLMCELIGVRYSPLLTNHTNDHWTQVSIMRSEFDSAEQVGPLLPCFPDS
jgi:hypothetical protein